MIDTPQVQLLNNQSFVEQKINLQPTHDYQVFFIPSFTLVATPIINAQATSFYQLFFAVTYADFPKVAFDNVGSCFINNFTLQYDLNYSKIPDARGQILLAKQISFLLTKQHKQIITEIINQQPANKKANSPGIKVLTQLNACLFKIFLPTAAIKSDELNVFHYSFSGIVATNTSLHAKIKSKTTFIPQDNSGTLSFYVNDKPKYQIITKPAIMSHEITTLVVNNPLIFTTFIPQIRNEYEQFTAGSISQKNLTGILPGKSLVDEVFQFNWLNFNFNEQYPLKVHYGVKTNNLTILNHQPILAQFIRNFTVHRNQFNFQQATNLVFSNNDLFSFKKLPAQLVVMQKPQNDDFFYQNYGLKLNQLFYQPQNKQYTSNVLLPYDQNINLTINMVLQMQTYFTYDFNFNFWEQANPAIINDTDGKIKSQITKQKPNIIKWWQANKISLTFDQISKYYMHGDFTFANYQALGPEKNEL